MPRRDATPLRSTADQLEEAHRAARRNELSPAQILLLRREEEDMRQLLQSASSSTRQNSVRRFIGRMFGNYPQREEYPTGVEISAAGESITAAHIQETVNSINDTDFRLEVESLHREMVYTWLNSPAPTPRPRGEPCINCGEYHDDQSPLGRAVINPFRSVPINFAFNELPAPEWVVTESARGREPLIPINTEARNSEGTTVEPEVAVDWRAPYAPGRLR